MSKEQYSSKDIIFGSRHQFLEGRFLLNALADQTVVGKDVKDFNYKMKIGSFNGNYPILVCNVSPSLYGFIGNISDLKEKISYFRHERFCPIRVVKDANEHYTLFSKDFDIHIPPFNQESFDRVAEFLLNADFYNKVSFGNKPSQNASGIYMFSDAINVHKILPLENKNYPFSAYLFYSSKNDHLQISVPKGISINEDLILELLSVEVKESELSSYHKNLIDENPLVLKPIEFTSKIEDKQKVDLSIHVCEDKILLKKIENKKSRII